MISIIVAKTKQQELFYLTGKYDREELRKIRLHEQFFCPTCHAPLLMKIGEINIPHFAHKTLSACDKFSEPESSLHLQGKLHLYHFFHQLNFKVELEKYFSMTRQRVDLLVDGHYALEFQCSAIPVLQLNERSNGYRQLNMKPIWLKGLKEPCLEEIGLLHLKSYEIAMRQSQGGVSFILLFYPPGNRFYYHSNLFYISSNRWIGKTKSIQATKQVFPFAVPKQLSKEEFNKVLGIFRHSKRRFIRNQLYTENRVKNTFCRLCYELRLDAANVPDLFGIPWLRAECLKQHPIIWQLQAVVAWEKGISIGALIASGRMTLADPSLADEAEAMVTDYLQLYLSAKEKTLTDSSFLDIVYDNYCKTVRKLRK
ncbi:competence protein CoiA family protein [Planococcus sp. CPCC 101016]|uniref:competence protein CoiA family protein n=1 Tax=Planococcus sp. CPCC 101016 TaxID=2599617 RepID=UPI0021BD801C|nr:competence protein CoiA family protein [Planococcus sp. CPCC 101016]